MPDHYEFDDPASPPHNNMALPCQELLGDGICYDLQMEHLNKIPRQHGLYFFKGKPERLKEERIIFVETTASTIFGELHDTFKWYTANTKSPTILSGLFQRYKDIVFCYITGTDIDWNSLKNDFIDSFRPALNKTVPLQLHKSERAF